MTTLLIATPAAPLRYIADLHLGHTKVIQYCARPFPSVEAMNIALLTGMREAEAAGARLIVLGDAAFDLPRIVSQYGWLDRPEDHVLIAGNHDRVKKFRPMFEQSFGLVVGTEKTWRQNTLVVEDVVDGRPVRVLCSHDPQRDLQGCTWNVHGHVHDNLIASPGAQDMTKVGWLYDSDRHLNAGVELTAYRPVSLEALIAAQGTPLRTRIADMRARRPDPRDKVPQHGAA